MTVPGCANQLDYCDPSRQANFWGNFENLDATADLWKIIAQRYRDRHNVAGYNLIHQPNAPSHESLKYAYEKLIEAVRSVDQEHIIFLDGNNYSVSFKVFTDGSLASQDSNLVYSFDLYKDSSCSPNLDWEADIREFLEENVFGVIKDQNIPIFLGEYGGYCAEWIELVHIIMLDKGVQHMAYYSPKCAIGSYEGSKCLSKLSSVDNWVDLLIKIYYRRLVPGWQYDLGFEDLGSSNFTYDQDRISILERDYR